MIIIRKVFHHQLVDFSSLERAKDEHRKEEFENIDDRLGHNKMDTKEASIQLSRF